MALLAPFEEGVKPPAKRSQKPNRKPVWLFAIPKDSKPRAIVVTPDAVLVAANDRDGNHYLSALNLADGKTRWKKQLPSPLESNGMILRSNGDLILTLQNGVLQCWGKHPPASE